MFEIESKGAMIYQFPDFINKNNEYIGNNLNDFEILAKLKDGKNSKIIKVKSKINNEIYAMKQIELKLIEKYDLQNEINLLKEINHTNIIKYYNIFDEGNYKYIIMEFMENDNLDNYKTLKRTFGINITLEKIIEIAYNCLNALEYIHSKGINRKILLKNIFIDKNLKIKIGIHNICSMIAFEPNQNQYRLDLQILGKVLDFLLKYYKNNFDEKEKEREIIITSFISYLIKENIISTNETKIKIEDIYINNCIKNSSIKSVFYCLNNFSIMNIFFSDNDIRNLLQKDQKGENKILAKQFLKIIMFLNKKDYNPQKNIENYIFEFRKTLNQVGFPIKNDNLEVFPEQLIPFILVKLNAELCEIAIPKNKEIEEREKKVFSILTKNKYYVNP